jgi:Fe-S cluster biosynthesis and repair protein YggX
LADLGVRHKTLEHFRKLPDNVRGTSDKVIELMARIVYCQVLKREAEGLEAPPHPGELGQRIYENVSQEAWQTWLERLTTILNENRISTADPESISLIEQHMLGFLFGEGDLGKLPPGYVPQAQKK